MDVAETAMIERIARVLAGQRLSLNAGGVSAHASADVDETWQAYEDEAIAVLRTMRAPDTDMAAAGDVAMWERMIAAALAEPCDDRGVRQGGAPRPVAASRARLPKVRSAGPEAIPGLPGRIARDWDGVDQAIDESFPASDPPGQGVT